MSPLPLDLNNGPGRIMRGEQLLRAGKSSPELAQRHTGGSEIPGSRIDVNKPVLDDELRHAVDKNARHSSPPRALKRGEIKNRYLLKLRFCA